MIPPAVREGLFFIIPLVIVGLLLLALQQTWAFALSFIVLLAIIGCAGFFRDPSRQGPAEAQAIVAAADGRVVEVEDKEEKDFGLGHTKRIAIFLSVFDVHVNRMPVPGTILKTIHHPGQFLDVRHPQAPHCNEYQTWLIETPEGEKVVVRQIAGLVARRIVAWAKEGQSLERGERFGMIRFGSRTEIFLPLNCQITIKSGDYVYGGATSIAYWPATATSPQPLHS